MPVRVGTVSPIVIRSGTLVCLMSSIMSIPVVISPELLRDWLEGRSQEDLQIFCEDPEEIKSTSVFSKSYLTYRIIMRDRAAVSSSVKACPSVQVRHRYSEFESLRSEMVNRYATCGILVPLLPPKKPVSSLIQGKQDSLFVKERTIGLSLFCEAVVQNPYLRYDVAWEEFLGNAAPTTANPGTPGFYKGESYLHATFELLNIKGTTIYDLMDKLTEVKDECITIEKNIKILIDKLKSVQSCERALLVANEGFSSALYNFAASEENVIRALKGDDIIEQMTLASNHDTQSPMKVSSFIRPVDYVSTTIKEYSSLLVTLNIARNELPYYIGVFFITILENELSLLDSFKELFKVHDDIQFNIEQAKKHEKINKAAELEIQLNKFYKGFYYITLPLACSLRSTNFRKAVTYMGSVSLTYANSIYLDTLKFFESISVNTKTVVEDTCCTLDQLSLKPLNCASLNLPEIDPTKIIQPMPHVLSQLIDKICPISSKNGVGNTAGSDVSKRAHDIFAKKTNIMGNTYKSAPVVAIDEVVTPVAVALVTEKEVATDNHHVTEDHSVAEQTEVVKNIVISEKNSSLINDLLRSPSDDNVSSGKASSLWD